MPNWQIIIKAFLDCVSTAVFLKYLGQGVAAPFYKHWPAAPRSNSCTKGNSKQGSSFCPSLIKWRTPLENILFWAFCHTGRVLNMSVSLIIINRKNTRKQQFSSQFFHIITSKTEGQFTSSSPHTFYVSVRFTERLQFWTLCNMDDKWLFKFF